MSDQPTTNTDFDQTKTDFDPTTPGTSGAPTAAPAGPGEDVDSGDREAVDSVGGTSGTPITRVVEGVADAAKTAGTRLQDAAKSADLDAFADEAKRVTGEWTERVKEEYRKRPGVVIAAAVGAVVVVGAIARAIGRRG